LPEASRLGVKQVAAPGPADQQESLFEQRTEPQWVEVDVAGVRVERCRKFGGPWLGLQLVRALEPDKFLERALPQGQEQVPWAMMALVLVLARLCDPSSELYLAEHGYQETALADLLGVPADKVNDDRLYRALDQLLPHKAALEKHLRDRLGELFSLEYDLLLYDITSTYFEGEAKGNAQAQRGYSRDHRPDCKQVCMALVVSRCEMPVGYQLFAGNRADVTTVTEIVETMEQRYGKADRLWVMDRGMVSEANLSWMREGGRRYIVGTPKGQLKRFERELLETNWETVRDGIDVKLCPPPDGVETFVLCRSQQRREKERALHQRFEQRLETGLEKLAKSCRQKSPDPLRLAQRVGRLLGQNSRAASLFQVELGQDAAGGATLTWSKLPERQRWNELAEGCYLLRSNVTDWTAVAFWTTYVQLTEAEAAFRIHKNDLRIRPLWHQVEDRVKAHILVCFLAYVLWKTLAQWCRRAGLGDEPRKVLHELAQIQLVDVVLPTKGGVEIRKRCITRPTRHQALLLQQLGLKLPTSLPLTEI
jgi:transposase